MSHAKRAGTLQESHLGTQSCTDVSSETGQIAQSQGMPQPRVQRMSQARRAGTIPENRMSNP
eukprot:3252988-Pyramimonas_sp.AAC.2